MGNVSGALSCCESDTRRIQWVKQPHCQRVVVETFIRDILPRKDSVKEVFLARYFEGNPRLALVLEEFGWVSVEHAFESALFQEKTTEYFEGLWNAFSTYATSPESLNKHLEKLGRFLRYLEGFSKLYVKDIEAPLMEAMTQAYLMNMTHEVQCAVHGCVVESIEMLNSIFTIRDICFGFC